MAILKIKCDCGLKHHWIELDTGKKFDGIVFLSMNGDIEDTETTFTSEIALNDKDARKLVKFLEKWYSSNIHQKRLGNVDKEF